MALIKARALMVGPGVTPWQWDPTDIDTARATLSASNGKNVVVTSTATVGDGGVSAWMGRTVGKWYFEMLLGATWSGSDTAIGLLKSGASHANLGGSGALGLAWYTTGTMWNGGSLGASGQSPAATNVCGFAADLDNNLCWATHDGSNWTFAGNPASGTNGKAGGWTVGNVVKPAVCFNSGTASLVVTLRLRKAECTLTIPTGFTAWEGW